MSSVLPIVYRATSFGRPIRVREELEETHPCHADMLRYDDAFCSPDDPSLVVFPLFKSRRSGMMPDKVTVARWDSFSIKLAELSQEALEAEGLSYIEVSRLNHWVTYQHAKNEYTGLVKMTLLEFLAANPELKLYRWRRV